MLVNPYYEKITFFSSRIHWQLQNQRHSCTYARRALIFLEHKYKFSLCFLFAQREHKQQKVKQEARKRAWADKLKSIHIQITQRPFRQRGLKAPISLFLFLKSKAKSLGQIYILSFSHLFSMHAGIEKMLKPLKKYELECILSLFSMNEVWKNQHFKTEDGFNSSNPVPCGSAPWFSAPSLPICPTW